MVGPAGFEPATKGFTSVPMFPKGVDYLFTRAEQVAGGGVRDALACNQGRLASDPEDRGQPSGSLCTFRRCTAGLAQGCHGASRAAGERCAEGFPEFIPSTSRLVAREGTLSMSPLH
jgi:hypothetical protein